MTERFKSQKMPWLGFSKPYKYSPLPGPDYIRLLILQPGRLNDKLAITLRTTELTKAVGLGFEALSYFWGTKEQPRRVDITHSEGKLHKFKRFHRVITQNLDEALRYLRHSTDPRILWIDALCIDQDNHDEKGLQVRKMGAIYHGASSVLAWLGPATAQTGEALEWMEQVGMRVKVDWILATVKAADAVEKDLWSGGRLLLDPGVAPGVLQILQAPWFRRVWIRQEIYLAKQEQARVLCGPYGTSWWAFRAGLAALYRLGCCVRERNAADILFETGEAQLVQERVQKEIEALDAFIFQRTPFGLADVRRNFGDAQCHDSRDRIFAALDLLRQSDAEIAGFPDYNNDVNQVYHNVAKRYFQQMRSTSLLLQCSLEESTDKNMPTWVPDWSRPLPASWLPGRSSTNLATPVLFSKSSSKSPRSDTLLSVYGTLGPRITYLGPVVGSGVSGNRSILRTILAGLLPASCFEDLNAPCASAQLGKTLIEQYATVLCAEGFRENFSPPAIGRPTLCGAVSVLRTWLGLETMSKLDAYAEAFSRSAMQDSEEQMLFQRVRRAVSGRRLALGPSREIMLVPPSARPEDRVCVLLGCENPMLLRRVGSVGLGMGAQYQVVGPCFVDGMQWGEALFGPLPLGSSRVYDLRLKCSVWLDSAGKSGTGKTRDPRLELFLNKLPEEVAHEFRQRHDDNTWANLQLNHAHLDILREHRRDVYPSGGDLQEFHLV